jgi:hypothetical protein
VQAAIVHAAWLLPLAAIGMGLLLLIARASARSAIYTITSRRVVMRFGAALPLTIQIPFRFIDGAGMRLFSDGTGDIPLALGRDQRIAWPILWPHARPWRLSRTEPMLRALKDAPEAARILAEALSEQARQAVAPTVAPAVSQEAAARPAPQPARHDYPAGGPLAAVN